MKILGSEAHDPLCVQPPRVELEQRIYLPCNLISWGILTMPLPGPHHMSAHLMDTGGAFDEIQW